MRGLSSRYASRATTRTGTPALGAHELIQSFGYAAVFVGAFLQGELILALSGLASQQGVMDLRAVTAVAALAGFLGNEFLFFLGRWHGRRILLRFPAMNVRAMAFDSLLSRYHALLIAFARFLYGFGVVGPIFLGMGRVGAWKFALYNALGSVIWAPLVAGAGYLFGHAIETFIREATHLQMVAFGLLGLAGAWYWHRRRKRGPRPDDS